jgi:nicotine blue oxidoreductase
VAAVVTPRDPSDGRTVAGLLLAAGAGSRFGRPKALVEFAGRLLVEHGIALLAAGGCRPVHVVVGAAGDEVRATADLGEAVVVDNPDWATGMGSSLRRGLAALPPAADAVVVALVDQPLVSPEAVRRLRAAYAQGAMAAVATYAGKPRNPVLLARTTWAEVAALAQGDVGARAYLRTHPELVVVVPCDDVSAPDDLDTPADLEMLRDRPRPDW